MKLSARNIGLTLLFANSIIQGVQAATECRSAWAHHSTKNICNQELGADYFGWTNGRFGIDDCDQCTECDACPTLAPAPTKAPTPSPVPLPKKCVGVSASWSGDPHFTTFDGLSFDCQGEGEFHVLKSLDSNFNVQGRFAKFRDNKRPTVTKSVAWTLDEDDPLIQVTVPDTPIQGSCMPHVHFNKVKTDVQSGFLDDSYTIQVALEERMNKKLQGYVFYYHNSGVQVTILAKKSSANGCVLSVKLCLPESWERTKENFVGLLGTPDGIKSNDWMDKNGNAVTVPSSKRDRKFQKSYDWCVENFCIQQESESIFAYENGDTFYSISQCALPPDLVTMKCVDTGGDTETGDLTETCAPEDFDCLIDGCVGGVEEAVNFLSTASALAVDGDCGKELLFEDFDGPDASEWGDIQQGDYESKFLFFSRASKSFAKTVAVPVGAQEVKVEFLFLEIGFWEGTKKKRYTDHVYLKIDGVMLDLTGIDKGKNKDNYLEGLKSGISWNRRAITPFDHDLGFCTRHTVVLPGKSYNKTTHFRTSNRGWPRQLMLINPLTLSATSAG